MRGLRGELEAGSVAGWALGARTSELRSYTVCTQ